MSALPCVLLVDDDPEIRETLSEYLCGRGLEVLLAGDGAQMKAVLDERSVDLVLLDLNLPGEGGLKLMQHIRKFPRAHGGKVGIIILTGVGDPEDRVLGLETGADDYVVKPFNLRELLARIHSVLRRAGDPARDDRTHSPGARFSGWTLLAADGVIQHDDGRQAEVSSGEIDLLRLLLGQPGVAVSREALLGNSSHRDLEPFDRSIDVRIARLRRKIEADPAHPEIIRTVRNVGYMLVSGP